ncbi:hypothetical protein JCM21900_002873 [Sporobolomyces salmonicolor]
MSSVQQILTDLPSPPPSRTLSSFIWSALWWIISWVPWYLWPFVALWAWLQWGRQDNNRVSTRARRRAPAQPSSQPAPSRPDSNPRQPQRVTGTPISIRSSTPQLSRRGSYARLDGAGGAVSDHPGSEAEVEMRERQRAGAGGRVNGLAREVCRSPRASYSPAPAPARPSPAPQAQQHHTYSSAALTRLSSSGLPLPRSSSRDLNPRAAAPVLPTSVRKRQHGADASARHKRSRFDALEPDEEEGMELDSFPLSRGTKRYEEDEEDYEEDGRAKRSRTAEQSEEGGGDGSIMEYEYSTEERSEPEQASPRKRPSRASPSPPLFEANGSRTGGRSSKKAKKGAIGIGAMRDKRPIGEVEGDEGDSYDQDEDEFAGKVGARNADSDVASGDEEEQEEAPEQLEPKRPSIKRFREKSRREGSDNDDLMGDDDLLAPPPPAAPGSTVKKRLPPTSKTSTPKKRLSSRSAASARKPKSSTPLSRLPSQVPVRKIGDQWTNHEGDQYRIDEDGIQRRLCEVKELRRKYRLPRDSKHPDARAMQEVVVEKWVTAEEYAALFEQRKLGWQVTREQEDSDNKAAAAAAAAAEGELTFGDDDQSFAKESGIYYTPGVNTPLRTHSRLPPSRSLSNVKLSASPSYSSLSNGRLRLPSSTSFSGSPARSWSASQAKRVVEDEAQARRERERRRKASVLLGGEEETVEEKEKGGKTGEKEEGGKLRLADYALEENKAEEKKPATAAPSLFAAPALTTKPAESAPSLFAAPASSVKPAKSAPAAPTSTLASKSSAAVPNFFSSTPAVTEKQAGAHTPALAPSFSFGASAAKPAGEALVPAKPSHSFGTPAAEQKKDDPLAAAKPAPFSFGALSTSTTASEAKKDESAKPLFGFGAPSTATSETKKEDSSAANSTPAPSFSFGTPVAEKKKEEPVKPSFAFGAPPTPASSTPRLSFGAPSTVTAPEAKMDEPPKPTPSFSLGAPAATLPAQEKKEEPKPSFSFGSSESKPASSAPSLSFGAPAASAPALSFGAPAASAPALSFGAPAASTPALSFGAPSSTATENKPAASSSFSLGAPATSTSAAPAVTSFGGFGATQPPSTTTNASAGFSFGQSSPSTAPSALSTGGGFSFGAAPSAAPPAAAAPPTSGFSFGASASSTAPSTGLSFGATSPVVTNTAAPSTGGFSFGAPAPAPAAGGTTTPGAGAGGFSFGGAGSGATSPAATGPGLFSFGAGGGGEDANATAPRRRIRRLPGQR